MTFTILQWNVKHFYKNKSSISNICIDLKPSVVCFQETWNQSNDESKMKIPTYNLISQKSRFANRGGGVAIFAANSTPANELTINSNLEICAARIYYVNQIYIITKCDLSH